MRWLSTAARTGGAEARVLERQQQEQRDRQPRGDEEKAIGAERHAHEVDGAAQIGRRLHGLHHGAEEIRRDRHRHEGEPDRQQHLIELGWRGRAGGRACARRRRSATAAARNAIGSVARNGQPYTFISVTVM